QKMDHRKQLQISGKTAKNIFMAAVAVGVGIPPFLSIPADADETAAPPSGLVTPSNAQIAAPSPTMNAFISNAIGPNTIADVAQAVAPSVVNIETDQEARPLQMPNFFFGQGM